MDLVNAVKTMAAYTSEYYGNCHYLVIYLICFLTAFLFFPGIRKKLLYPILVLYLFILNPVLYVLVYHRIIYWRLYWMIPGAMLTAGTFLYLLKRIKKRPNKIMFALAALLILFCFGNNVYIQGGFQPTANLEKIKQGVIDVSDIILSYKENPRCLVRSRYLTEMRQYSADIQLAYGRDVYGYVSYTSEEMKALANSMESARPDYDSILAYAVGTECDFVVTHADRPISADLLDQYHYREVARKDGSIIYFKK